MSDTTEDTHNSHNTGAIDPVELWHRSTAVEFLQGLLGGAVAPDPHYEHVGVRLVKAEAGRLELEWVPTDAVRNRGGTVHGGYLGVVLDDASGMAASSVGERFVPMLTLELRIEYIRPVLPHQPYSVVGTVVHAGKTRVISDGRVEDADGRLIARSSGSFVPNRSFPVERFAS